ncbi:ThiF family adenylyltransferase [Radiobacillus deserti]|uniref:THIF-type NAD/FAD binding fold domain-containing protein n=1 Tax=Radiobacillus deserti TaxID=2594883 RepID=A0A516KDU8_9BACI|nr:ThiF family adenylyltransferase [Radiobacillus deserti]QDP39486.1 hypothetical protein FN924_04435 [Radiobacillus deserti]
MKLRNSLNFRGYPERREIEYYDGENKTLEVNDFELVWSLLEILKEGTLDEKHQDIQIWKTKININNEEFDNLVSILKDNNLLINYPNDIEEFEYEFTKRQNDFLSNYDKTLGSMELSNKINKIKAVIIGAGTIGSTLAITLAKLGVGELILIDNDSVQLRNIKPQLLFDLNDVNKKKIKVIEKRIKNSEPYTKITTIDKKVLGINDISSLNLEGYQYIFGCFDDATESLHNDIIKFSQSNGIKYIQTGYFNDNTLVSNLCSQNGHNSLKESYRDYYTPYYIGENRGTIIQSLAASLLISRLIIEDVFDFDQNTKKLDNIDFDFLDIKINTSREETNNKLIEVAQKIMPLDEKKLNRKINYIREYVENNETVNEQIEMEITSIYQVFNLLQSVYNLEEISLEKPYLKFMDFLYSVDSDLEEGIENLYLSYKDIISNIMVEYDNRSLHIFHALGLLNEIEDYTKKQQLQDVIYKAIYSNIDEIINLLLKYKLHFIEHTDLNEYLVEVIGINNSILSAFNLSVQKQYKFLLDQTMETLFKESDKGDYLHYYNRGHFSDYYEAKEIIIESLQGVSESLLPPDFLEHIERMLENNYVIFENDSTKSDINQNVYFPSIKENIIVLKFENDWESFFTVFHELGHSYFNLSYKESFFDDSSQIINEIVAYYFEITCIKAILTNNQLSGEFKDELAEQYIARIHKVVLNTFGIHLLESEIFDYIKDNRTFNIKDFLDIRKKFDKHNIFENVKFKNQEHSYLNVFLNSNFIFEPFSNILEPISYFIAVFLFENGSNEKYSTILQIKQRLNNGETSLEQFLSSFTNMTNEELLEVSAKYLNSLISYLKEINIRK